ncbi:MAG: hypothetical protein HW419_1089, partial [Deltaproteobacteria bacterium]|nr:hypothetical protein [Deltaproteobacteria bacterium]
MVYLTWAGVNAPAREVISFIMEALLVKLTAVIYLVAAASYFYF